MSVWDYGVPTALDVIDTTESVTVPTTATVLVPSTPTIKLQNGNVEYDSTTGVTTIKRSGTYQLILALNTSATANCIIYSYAEADVGDGWVTVDDSGRASSITARSDGQVYIINFGYFKTGTKLRLYYWASGTVELVTTTIASPVYIPALRLQYTQ